LTRILRGQARSKPLEAVVDEVRTLVRCGYKEVVLVGVNLGAYGHDSGQGNSLLGLGRALLTDTDVPRLRFSSIEPWDVCEEFFDLWDSPRVCRQIHLPLQAGCDDTLRRMGRPITTEAFLRLLQAARQRIPELAVTTDMMVAFPGENERAFRESLAFVERCAFARLHVFPYSARPGTRAAHMALLPPEVVNARADAMRNLGQRLAAQYRDRFIGQRMAVLWERRRADGRWYGWTDNYLRVAVESACDLHNRIIPTELVGTSEGVLSGHLRLNRDGIPAIGA
jgi:threonylcarbamoyladenosine tRNA methylthiotransferase MtaB